MLHVFLVCFLSKLIRNVPKAASATTTASTTTRTATKMTENNAINSKKTKP